MAQSGEESLKHVADVPPEPPRPTVRLPPGVPHDRRRSGERRRRFLWSLLYGGLRPRRNGGRRAEDHHRPIVDWHSADLWFSAVSILLLCVADAFLTLTLLRLGAYEANPVMALFVYDDVRTFAIVKLALTGLGVIALVAIARFRVFRVLRVATILHVVLVGYVALVAYEVWLLRHLQAMHAF